MAQVSPDDSRYSAGSTEVCLPCHDKTPASYIVNTPHDNRENQRTPFAQHECESSLDIVAYFLKETGYFSGDENPPLPGYNFRLQRFVIDVPGLNY